MKLLKFAVSSAALSLVLTLSGCSLFSVYKIDLPQGSPVTQTQAQRLQLGMSKAQVTYLLGSPAIKDTLAPNRWDYIYDYVPGTYGKREDKEAVQNASHHLTVYFDAAGRVSQVQGIDSLPVAK